MIALLTACGLLDAEGEPRIEAHRCGAGYFPENSLSACTYALEQGFGTLEFDLVVTSDDVAVIHHDPFVNPEVCTRVDGTHLGEDEADRVYIKDITAAELRENYVCGGIEVEDFPEQALVEEPIMTWAELLDLIEPYPDPYLHIDIKWEGDLSRSPEVYADVVMNEFWDRGLANDYYVSGEYPEVLQAVEALDSSVVTSWSWPSFPDGESTTLVAIGHEFQTTFGTEDLVQLARDAGVDELNIPWQVADRRRLEDAVAAGLPIQLWTINTAAGLEAFGKWPVEALITDYPAGDAP